MEFLPGGRFRSIHIPLLPVLATAYNLPFATREYRRIKNVPDWIFSEPYDIEAMRLRPCTARRGHSDSRPGRT
jgi:hypothetical protein